MSLSPCLRLQDSHTAVQRGLRCILWVSQYVLPLDVSPLFLSCFLIYCSSKHSLRVPHRLQTEILFCSFYFAVSPSVFLSFSCTQDLREWDEGRNSGAKCAVWSSVYLFHKSLSCVGNLVCGRQEWSAREVLVSHQGIEDCSGLVTSCQNLLIRETHIMGSYGVLIF